MGPAAEVRLVREFKGLTVRDLVDDHEIAAQLPGRVQSALQLIERGDLAAADAMLPGQFADVLQGPGHARRRRRRHLLWIAIGLLAVAAAAATMARW